MEMDLYFIFWSGVKKGKTKIGSLRLKGSCQVAVFSHEQRDWQRIYPTENKGVTTWFWFLFPLFFEKGVYIE